VQNSTARPGAPGAPDGRAPFTPSLVWGIKSSFLRYLASLPDGGYQAGPGVTVTADGEFCFPPDARLAGPRHQAFRGEVRFSGHGAFLYVRIADPRVEFPADPVGVEGDARLTVAGEGSARLHLADLSLMRRSDASASSPAMRHLLFVPRLTAAGAEVFGGVYPAGTPLDPLIAHSAVGDHHERND